MRPDQRRRRCRGGEIGAGTYFGTLKISKNLTLQGVSASETMLDGAYGQVTVVIIDPGATVSLQDLTVQRGGSSDFQNRGGVWVQGT